MFKKTQLLQLIVVLFASTSIAFSDEVHFDECSLDHPPEKLNANELSWQKTGLEFKTVDHFLKPDICYDNSEWFVACVSALNAGLSYGKNHFLLVSKYALQQTFIKTHLKRIIENHGNLVLIEIQKDPSSRSQCKHSSLEIIQAQRVYIKSEASALEYTFLETQNKPIDFAYYKKWISDHIVTPENEASVSAAIWNAYLEISIDPNTYITPKQLLTATMEHAQKTRIGIGANFTREHEQIKITPEIGTPADRAGLRSGDELLAINGVDVTSLALSEVSELLDQEHLELKIKRKDGLSTIKLQQEIVETPNVSLSIFNHFEKKTAFLKIDSFMPNSTANEVKIALNKIIQDKIDQLIIDLRSNQGGQIEHAVKISSYFLPQKTPIASLMQVNAHVFPLKEKNINKKYITLTDPIYDGKIIILIGPNSASASEVLAGTLQDHQRATLVGSRSHGKGSAMMNLNFSMNSNINLIATIALYFLPKQGTPHVRGLTPNLLVSEKASRRFEEQVASKQIDHLFYFLRGLTENTLSSSKELEVESLNKQCRKHIKRAETTFQNLSSYSAVEPDFVALVGESVFSCLK